MRTYVRDSIGRFATSPDGGPVGRGAKTAPKSVKSGSMSARAGAGPKMSRAKGKWPQFKNEAEARSAWGQLSPGGRDYLLKRGFQPPKGA